MHKQARRRAFCCSPATGGCVASQVRKLIQELIAVKLNDNDGKDDDDSDGDEGEDDGWEEVDDTEAAQALATSAKASGWTCVVNKLLYEITKARLSACVAHCRRHRKVVVGVAEAEDWQEGS
eukprot:366399-Chlamydomonas_euryale.AAC.47